MKYIFDFDDVLVHTTKKIKEHTYSVLEKAGVSRGLSEEYIEKERRSLFSLKKMLAHFSVSESLYEEIMKETKNFVNNELVEIVKKIGKSDCYIITYGDKEFQMEKIKRAGIESLFSEIIVVLESKKEAVEKICAQHRDEKVIFIDDKAKHFKDLDFVKYPNLKTILYDEKSFKKVTIEINK